MSINRTKLWLGIALPLLLVSFASAQELKEDEWLPNFHDVKIGAKADLSRYGKGPKPKRGWFLTAEALGWAIAPPHRTLVGLEGYSPLVGSGAVLGFPTRPSTGTGTGTTPTNGSNAPGFLTVNFFNQPATADTGFITQRMGPGQRYQLGYMDDDGKGWMVGTIVLQTQTNRQVYGNAGVPIFAPFTNGINPLEGFIPGPNGVALDVNGNHVFGPNGIDLGTPNASPPPPFVPPFDGIPDAPHATDFGDLVQFPVIFKTLVVRQQARLWGIEVMRLWDMPRHPVNRPGFGTWQVMAGVRYLRFRDNFLVDGSPDVQTQVNNTGANGATTGGNNQIGIGVLGFSRWFQTADNNLIGPQLGFRWSAGKGRLTFNTEVRGMAAANFQTFRQTGFYGSQPSFVSQATTGVNPGGTTGTTTSTSNVPNVQPGTPIALVPQSFAHNHFATQFSPVGELRLNLNYQIYKALSVQAGWTGLVMGGMGRAADSINWSLPNFGIRTDNDRQAVFVQGLTVGVMLNR